MGVFNSDLLGVLGREASKDLKFSGYVKDDFFKSDEANYETAKPNDAEDPIVKRYKDALFSLVLFRARNYMRATGQDAYPEEKKRKAVVDISLTFDFSSFYHFVENEEAKPVTANSYLRDATARTIRPTVAPSVLDTVKLVDKDAEMDLTPLVQELDGLSLPCRMVLK